MMISLIDLLMHKIPMIEKHYVMFYGNKCVMHSINLFENVLQIFLNPRNRIRYSPSDEIVL